MDVCLFGKFDFFTGVPDSLLKPLCDWLLHEHGVSPRRHIVAANEGNAVAIAAGYHLATGKIPVVYLQNSGIGNIINPVASLLSDRIYGIPVLFIVGWRGEPGVPDEPQHAFQGEVTVKLLETMDVCVRVIGAETTQDEFNDSLAKFEKLFAEGKSAAFVVRKGALTYNCETAHDNGWNALMLREDVIRSITSAAAGDVIVSTTGKTSRELFEIRERNGGGHAHDFLTVGSMGHSSSIALGIALNHPNKRVWVIDGDGACLMHAGAMAVIGASAPENLVHVVINNAAHESVGGMPTAAGRIDLTKVAQGFGYPLAESVSDFPSLESALERIAKRCVLSFLEVKSAVGARSDLGRPATPPRENKERFMDYLLMKNYEVAMESNR